MGLWDRTHESQDTITAPWNRTLDSWPETSTELQDTTAEWWSTTAEMVNMDASLRVFETITLSVMWLLCLIGNMLVCIVIHRSRRLQSTTNYFIVAMAAADLMYALVVVPFLMGWVVSQEWLFRTVMCKIIRFVQFWFPATTTFIMVAITIDRFYTILYPLSFKITRSKAKQMIVAAWGMGAIFALPALYLFGRTDDSRNCELFLDSSWHSFAFLCSIAAICYILPIMIMCLGLCRICRYIWQTGVGGRTFQRTTNPVPRAKVKAIKMIMVLLVVNCLLFGCFYMIQLFEWISRPSSLGSHSSPPYSSTPLPPSLTDHVTLYIVMTWIVCLSTVSKPAIYTCYNSNFRRGCQEVFCMSAMKCYRTNAYTITTASKFGKKNHVGVYGTSTDYQKVDSPSKTFNRSMKIESATWPLAQQNLSTYL